MPWDGETTTTVRNHPFKYPFRCTCEAISLVRYGTWGPQVKWSNATPRYGHGARQQARLAGGGSKAPLVPPALKNVGAVVAVASCKGGVGESTVAANLAWALAARGGRVGLLDMDIYGPSLPTLLRRSTVLGGGGEGEGTLAPAVRRSPEQEKMVLPVACEGGVGAMSFGWVNAKAGVKGAGGTEAAVVRGPVASRVATQLLLGTDWGELDYLVGAPADGGLPLRRRLTGCCCCWMVLLLDGGGVVVLVLVLVLLMLVVVVLLLCVNVWG